MLVFEGTRFSVQSITQSDACAMAVLEIPQYWAVLSGKPLFLFAAVVQPNLSGQPG